MSDDEEVQQFIEDKDHEASNSPNHQSQQQERVSQVGASAEKATIGPSIAATIISMVVISLIIVIAFLHSKNFSHVTADIVKPIVDDRSFGTFQLANGINVLIVSDPTTTSSGASLEVRVGQFADPNELPGLAHFCEHMVFLYNNKYPTLNEFQSYVAKYGGQTNAFTALERTNFYFELTNSAFAEGLDRFSHFFIDPIFDQQGADGELPAVNSEFERDVGNPAWQTKFLAQTISDPKSLYSRFSIGNFESLRDKPNRNGIDVVESLQNYFDTYYSAGLMSLAVISNETRADIEIKIKQLFSKIPDQKISQPSYHHFHKPFDGEYGKQIIQFMPLDGTLSVTLLFQTESQETFPQIQPLGFLTVFISSQSEGSLNDYLQKKGWAYSLDAGVMEESSYFNIFAVEISLTEEGYKNLESVIEAVFAEINLLKEEANTEENYHKVQKMTEISFNYSRSTDGPGEEASGFASNLNLHPQKYAVSGGNLLYFYDPIIVGRFIEQINTENMVILVGNPEFESDTPADQEEKEQASEDSGASLIQMVAKHKLRKEKISANAEEDAAAGAEEDAGAAEEEDNNNNEEEDANNTDNKAEEEDGKDSQPDYKYLEMQKLTKYNELYNLKYASKHVNSEFIEVLNKVSYKDYEGLSLPAENQYLPHDLSLIKVDCKENDKQCHEDYIKDADTKEPKKSIDEEGLTLWYQLDRSFLAPKVYSSLVFRSPLAADKEKYMITEGVFLAIVQTVMTKNISLLSEAGNDLSISQDAITIFAFSSVFEDILDSFLEVMTTEKFKEDDFNLAKEQLNVAIQSKIFGTAVEKVIDRTKYLMTAGSYTPEELLKALEEMTYDKFNSNLEEYRKENNLEVLIIGNILEDDAKKHANSIKEKLGFKGVKANEDTTHLPADISGHNMVFREENQDENNRNGAITNVYQIGQISIETYLYAKLIEQCVSNDAYTYLRSEKNLGYVVAMAATLFGNNLALEVVAEGSTYNPNEMNLEIENFWKMAHEKVKDLSQDDFDILVSSLQQSLETRDITLDQRGKRYLMKISDRTYEFNLRDKALKMIPDLNIKLMERILMEAVFKPNKLSVQMYKATGSDEKLSKKLLSKDQEMCGEKAKFIEKKDIDEFDRIPSGFKENEEEEEK